MKQASILLIAVTISLTGFLQKTSAQTAGEVLKKAIAFHDPEQKWTDYSGKVFLSTTFADGRNSGGEIIEVGTGEDYYKCIRLSSKITWGIKNGEVFREVEGNKSPDADMIKKSGTSDESIQQYKGWHYFHFGILSELKASGLVLDEKVETVKFQGNDCLSLQFICDDNKLKDEFYKGTNWTLFIDPDDFSLRGLRETGLMNRYAILSGILNINGLKLPLCRVWFNNEDNSFFMADVFANPSSDQAGM